MIEELHIANLGVIADALIEFDSGLTVITGETGAGKTMVLTGLSLLLGGKADPELVRPGQDQAAVEGRLLVSEGHQALSLVEEAGGMLDDGALLVARTVASKGRSRAFAGGRSIPRALLGQIGSSMVTVHGQSDQLRLRAPAQQRQALDAFAGEEHQRILADYSQAFRDLAESQAALRQWDEQAKERQAELEYLTRALEQFAELDPQTGEDAQLAAEAERLTNVEELAQAAQEAYEGITGLDEPDAPAGALNVVDHASHTLQAAGSHDNQLAAWSQQLADITYQLSDLTTELSGYLANLEANPERLEYLHSRRAQIAGLIQEYTPGADLEALVEFASKARERLTQLNDPESGREALTLAVSELDERVTQLAERVTRGRAEAAGRMGEAIDAELAALAMPAAHVTIECEQLAERGPHGCESVQFLLTPHSGAPARPLAKGASGGELSRVMLAIEVALAHERAEHEIEELPTFVFDEVDAGVGGRAAVHVGQHLAELSQHAQVIVVTHLAQVAAFADRHVVVTKHAGSASEGITSSDIRQVSEAEREAELARMLGGDADSDAARRHAAELLARADVGT